MTILNYPRNFFFLKSSTKFQANFLEENLIGLKNFEAILEMFENIQDGQVLMGNLLAG